MLSQLSMLQFSIRKSSLRLSGLTLVLVISGCTSNGFLPQPDDPFYAPKRPYIPQAATRNNGAIYQTGYEMMLYEDIKARRVGDIITVIFDENTNAAKKADTSVDKEQDITMPNPTVFGNLPNFKIPGSGDTMHDLSFTVDTSREFSGSGDSKQSNQLQGKITVTVTDVLENGNLIVKGEKWITLNQGDEFIRLTGIVRQNDITPENTVTSSRLADSRISYSGRGAVADSNAMGWGGRILNHWIWPF